MKTEEQKAADRLEGEKIAALINQGTKEIKSNKQKEKKDGRK
jgi:hypothetical protein